MSAIEKLILAICCFALIGLGVEAFTDTINQQADEIRNLRLELDITNRSLGVCRGDLRP